MGLKFPLLTAYRYIHNKLPGSVFGNLQTNWDLRTYIVYLIIYCGGLHLVINTYFILYICLANYGASEAVYQCVVVEKIHKYF